MGQDQKIKSRHKRRTVDHKKHSAFPGMRISKDMTIVNQSIKTEAKPYTIQSGVKSRTYSHPLWIVYDIAATKLGFFGGSDPLAARRRTEFQFINAYRALMKEGLVYRIKKKYLS